MEVIKTDYSSLVIHEDTTNILQNIDLHMIIEFIETNNQLNHYPEIKVMGRICHQRRDVGFLSDISIGYEYSNQIAESKPLGLCKLLLVNINSYFNEDFNGILINKYTDGSDYICTHSDNEKYITSSGVVILSFGATRNFRIRDKKIKPRTIIKDIPLISRQIIQMLGDFQKEFTHEIPIQKKVKETRYSFTFRKHLR
jgi:alkylated DNA repair dioxygenase AlkB